MNQVNLISKKRDGNELSEQELEFLISGYVAGDIPDYQISAFLMAVYFQGMSAGETATLTRLMRDSGIVLEHSALAGFAADKHSTGGVGDKVSLILAPLVAAAGLYVPMISGRALIHTGGTLDKLEAIPGFRTNLSMAELHEQLKKIGVVLVGQTDNLTPADKKIYALRDATATVNSIPLITASILSKKMAEGIDALVLDVKAGSGAIFRTKEEAWELGRKLVATADRFNLRVAALITAMEQPLGNTVGNWLETREAIDTLQGKGPADLTRLTLILSAQMLLLGNKAGSLEEGIALLQDKITSGAAFEKFLQIVQMQDGDVSLVKNPQDYPAAKFCYEYIAPRDGYVSAVDAREIGNISMALGAGRASMEDGIDYTAGIVLRKKVGDKVQTGEVLACAHSEDRQKLTANEERLNQAFSFSADPVPQPPLLYGLIDPDGEKDWDPDREEFVISQRGEE